MHSGGSARRNSRRGEPQFYITQDIYVDDGYSGSTLVRPALERLRDRVGAIDRLYVHSPDRLAYTRP